MSAPATGAPGSPTLASVLRCALPAYTQSHRLPAHHWKVLRAIQACRTPDLGGHLYQCPHCRAEHFVPHSCRNRHCPTCQGANSVDWLEKQAQALLPIPYFHLVFTLPHDLNALIQHNNKGCIAAERSGASNYTLYCSAASAPASATRRHLMNLPLAIRSSPRATVGFHQPAGPGPAVPSDASSTRIPTSGRLHSRAQR